MAVYRCFAISPNHVRRVCGHKQDSTNRLWLSLGCNIRHGVSWAMGKPIHRAWIKGLQGEGLKIWNDEQVVLAKARKKKPEPIQYFTLEDLDADD